MQVQDFALAGEEVVLDVEAVHRLEMAAQDGGVGLVTFNQPEKRNAMSMEMWIGLGEILEEFEADDTINVVVLSGAHDVAAIVRTVLLAEDDPMIVALLKAPGEVSLARD